MKHYLSVLLILLSFSLNAQDDKINFGTKVGLNYSDYILGKEFPSNFPGKYNARIGFHIGVYANISISNKIYFKPELLYSLQGAEYEIALNSFLEPDDNFNNVYKTTVKEHLIIIPFVFDYYVAKSFNLEFGPQLGYILDTNISDNSFYSASKEDIDLSLNLGVGVNFAKSFRVGLRYNYGILERGNLKSSIFQLSLYYKIF